MAKKTYESKDKLVLFIDIMGFKERVNRVDVNELKKQLKLFKTKNNKLKPLLQSKTDELIHMAQFSDSIVLVTRGGTIEDLNRISKAAAILMQTGMETGFALRGAIAKGKMVFDKEDQLFFGKALVDAYLLEEELSYYGIVFHESVEDIISEALVKDMRIPIADIEVPLKKGKSKHYHVSWYEINEIMKISSIKNKAMEWLNKLRKTVSGNPRVYLDNTINVIEAEEKEDIESTKLYKSNTEFDKFEI